MARLDSHDAMLGMLSFRQSEEWVKAVKITSAMDFITFANAKLGRTQEQEAVSVTTIIGLLKTPVFGSS